MWSCLLRRYLLLMLPLGSVLSLLWQRQQGGDLALTVTLWSGASLLLAVWLERCWPYHPGWSRGRGDGVQDVHSAVLLLAVLEPALKAGTELLLAWSLPLWLPLAGGSPFPVHWPYAAQVLLATLLLELGRYCSHRWHHAWPGWWRLHALHHGSQRLYSLNNLRLHPLNHVFNFALSVLPLTLLGMPAEVLYGYLALAQPVVMLQHANIALDSRWLNHVFNSNEVHRWHHSTRPNEGDRNFGYALVLWDKLFGTFYLPERRRGPYAVGLYPASRAVYPYRRSYWRQVWHGLQPGCC